MDFIYKQDENGNYILDEHGSPLNEPLTARPVNWTEWIQLPVRSWEMQDAIHYGNQGQKIMRAPTVLIAKNYHKMPRKSFRGKPSNDAIYLRDGGVDQYTGKHLNRDEATVDHITPKSRGGRDVWENLALTSKEINSKKGNKFNHEIGLKLIRQPKAPKSMTAMEMIRDIKHPTWKAHLPHLATVESSMA